MDFLDAQGFKGAVGGLCLHHFLELANHSKSFRIRLLFSSTQSKFQPNQMKKNLYLTIWAALMSVAVGLGAQTSTATFKAVLNGNNASHQAQNYATFRDEAPTDWANFVAGTSGYGGDNGALYLTGLNWNPDGGSHTGLDNADDVKSFLRQAANNGFDLVYMYATGENDPDYVDYMAQHGCAVITKYGDSNQNIRLDYRNRRDLPIRALGPTPAMTVSGGSLNATISKNQYGPQLEFIDNYDQQSYIFRFTAAKYAVLKSAHPTWNVFDVRQALRQTCTHYTAGWCEEVGYGFPQVITRNNNGGSSSQPTLPTNAEDLQAGPPIQPSAQISSDGYHVVFRWYNFRQTGFISTVIKVNEVTIFDGDATEFVWSPPSTGQFTAQFYTKLSGNRLSRLETYSSADFYVLYPQPFTTGTIIPKTHSATEFSFIAFGPRGSYWNVFESTDLVSWRHVDVITFDSGPVAFSDYNLTGVSHRYYKLSNGSECSRVFGFYQVTVGAGYTPIANQLDVSADGVPAKNTLATVFSDSILPSGTVFIKGMDASLPYIWNGSSWSSSITFSPGEAGFIQNNSGGTFKLTLIGYVREGNLVTPLPYSTSTSDFVSSQIPKAGGIQTALGYQPTSAPNGGDLVYTWSQQSQNWHIVQYYGAADATENFSFDGTQYSAGWYDGAGNSYAEPAVDIGVPFAIFPATQNQNWVQNFDGCSSENIIWNKPTTDSLWYDNYYGDFSFLVYGIKGSHWDVYQSSDLKNWVKIRDGITLDASGTYWFDDDSSNLVSHRYYKLSNGSECSRVFGFYQVTVGAGYTPIANQLDVSADGVPAKNTLATVFSDSILPSGTVFIKGMDASLPYIWNGSSWSSSITFSPGEAGFIQNNSGGTFKLTLIGYVREGNLVTPLPYSTSTSDFVSSQIPKAGGIQTALGYQPTSAPNGGDLVYTWSQQSQNWHIVQYYGAADATENFSFDGTQYSAGWYDGAGNSYAEPAVDIGVPFAIFPATQNQNWVQNFDGWQ